MLLPTEVSDCWKMLEDLVDGRDHQIHFHNVARQVGLAAGVVHQNIVQLLDMFVEGERYVLVVSQVPSSKACGQHHLIPVNPLCHRHVGFLLADPQAALFLQLAYMFLHSMAATTVGAGRWARFAGLAKCSS